MQFEIKYGSRFPKDRSWEEIWVLAQPHDTVLSVSRALTVALRHLRNYFAQHKRCPNMESSRSQLCTMQLLLPSLHTQRGMSLTRQVTG